MSVACLVRCWLVVGRSGAEAGGSYASLFEIAPDLRPSPAFCCWVGRAIVATVLVAACAYSTGVTGLFDSKSLASSVAGDQAGMTAPPGKVWVCWLAVSMGLRPAGKGNVSKQVVSSARVACASC